MAIQHYYSFDNVCYIYIYICKLAAILIGPIIGPTVCPTIWLWVTQILWRNFTLSTQFFKHKQKISTKKVPTKCNTIPCTITLSICGYSNSRMLLVLNMYRNSNHIYNCIKTKCQGINLAKEVKDLYTRNYNTLMKDLNGDINKCKDIPCYG